MMGYLLMQRAGLRDWGTVNNTHEWVPVALIFKSLESAQAFVLSEFYVERIEWREFNEGYQWRALAISQPLISYCYTAFMVIKVDEETETTGGEHG